MDGASVNLGRETIYGTHEESGAVMSEKVQALAGSIYQEFEKMIARYDEDVVKTLMPLLVNVLECLDEAYQQNQEHDVELELLREDNEQLVTQYEREKVVRKIAEQKLLEIEDAAEGEKKELISRVESLESIVRILELKHKNSMDHSNRLEERETELKREYSKLHERYTELFKTHMDYIERTKVLISNQQISLDRSDIGGRLTASRPSVVRSSGPISFGFASLETSEMVESLPPSPISSSRSSPSLHNEMSESDGRLKQQSNQQNAQLQANDKINDDGSPSQVPPPASNKSKLHTKKEQRSGNTLYQELSFQEAECEEEADITGGWVHPGEYASSVSDNFYGMGKEVENLIMENNELLATKNALNVVKDDLIVKVDELTGELDMLREEILALNLSKSKLQERIATLEEEQKKSKEANETKQEFDDESDVPMAQRKRFTRVEMARVLMDRNQYKEKYMELQEAVRWAEMIRASKSDNAFDKRNKQSIWRIFSNLFSGPEKPQRSNVSPHLRYQKATGHVAPGIKALTRSGQEYVDAELVGPNKFAMRRAVERREHYRYIRAHVKKDDGRLQAYGWSLPGRINPSAESKESCSSSHVPVPVYCQPLVESADGMKIWCAAGVNLMGGYTKDGGLMVGGSVFYSEEAKADVMTTAGSHQTDHVDALEQEVTRFQEGVVLETKLSSMVWICTYAHSTSIITVLDANNPAETLSSFGVCTNHVLCVSSVPGASPQDYHKTFAKCTYTSGDTSTTTTSDCEAVSECNATTGEIHTADVKPTDRVREESEEANLLGQVRRVQVSATPIAQQQLTDVKTQLDTSNAAAAAAEEGTNEISGTVVAEDCETSMASTSNRKDTMSTVLATMWLGAENGMIYLYSAVSRWSECLRRVKLNDAVISIEHVGGRVIVGLACGALAVFARNSEGEWDLSNYYLVKVGVPHHSVRCLSVVGHQIWCGYRNKIHVFDPQHLRIVHSLEAHPRRESPVRQIAWFGDGVWVSIRLDSTLRLYHAHTYQHLQDVDVDPYVSKMLGTGKVGFSFVRITSLLISSKRLWIGTSNGVIISVPLSLTVSQSIDDDGNIVCTSDGHNDRSGRSVAANVTSFIPYCSMAHAQLSFHGHRDCVKFFVAVPASGGLHASSSSKQSVGEGMNDATITATAKQQAMLVISGGEGYIDFRNGNCMEESIVANDLECADSDHRSEIRSEKSHLIVWEVNV